MRAKIGEVYCFRLHGGGYSAVQIVAESHGRASPSVQLIRLDVDTGEPPTAQQADDARPAHGGEDLHGTWVPDLVPWWAHRVEGATIRRPACEKEAWGGWASLTFCIPRAVRASYVPRPKWRYDREPITISIGGEPFETSRDDRLLSTLGRMPPGDGPADWPALEPLHCVGSICHAGPDRGLIDAVRSSHPHVQSLAWTNPQTDLIDLRGTFFNGLTLLEIDRPLRLILPITVRSLDLKDSANLVTVEAPDLSEHFRLWLREDLARGAPKGLGDLQCLINFAKTDLAAIAVFPRLASLTLHGVTGGVRNIGALRQLSNLREFTAYDMYGFDASEFPTLADCPLLQSVEINGLRAADKQTLATRLKNGPHLAFSKVRTEKWLADNIDNPFRDWDADGQSFAKAAMKAWKNALQQARAIEGAPSAAQATEIILSITGALNKLDSRHPIDTLRREEACEAIQVLARAHLGGVLTPEETQETVDKIRNW
jgi:hypothetical protein